MMKKIFTLMIIAGFVLAMATAGGADSGVLGADRMLVQSLISSVLILTGGYFTKRGENA